MSQAEPTIGKKRRSQSSDVPTSGIHSLLKLLPFAKPFTWNFIVVLFLVIIYNGTSVLQPYLVKIAIDRDLSVHHPNYQGLLHITIIYVVIVVLGVVANFAQVLVLQYSGQSIIREIRLQLFRHIEKQSMSFFDTNSIGRLVTNVSSDTETVSQFFTQFFLSMMRDGLSVVMIVIAMFELNVKIAAISMIILPILFGISFAFRNRLRNAYQATRSRLSAVVSFLAENLAGMRIIQIFHQERRQDDRFGELNEKHRRANVREYRTSVFFNRVLELVGNLAVAAVVWFGGGSVLHGAILFGTLYAFISYIRQFFQPINSMTQQWNTLQSSMVSADRIGKLLEREPSIQDKPAVERIADVSRVRGQVEFRGVTFSYQPDMVVLKNISFRVEPGEFIGVVGPTGAGKSSIISLLARFYEPQMGSVLIDGKDVRDYAQDDLHQVVGLVQQEVNLFTGTVLDNIRLFREDIPRERVVAAAERVGAHHIIERMPHAYDTPLVGKGQNLSMGERQLLSFARIIALDPRILILDEATANLDSQTEELVQQGLQAVSASRTTLVIAHRLATIRHADQILVLEKGQLVERGRHDELVAKGGLYALLAEKSGVNARVVSGS
ncbi:MAG: ABC transporter ATP-binding protein [Alicyclobacillaceae bacterium]|uniref:ABC transporter ATP-binding protein n=1 Tax=Alicyclobacillus sp. SP_1 TaxID=2942475 RepID=UPI00215880BB|nr:ABC transporter ATP-binding protein [Alicyclobacillus sp. SP_1]MCY0889274.1 ABC transporter ATP-binding protein [Alicyclobacillaceae bacterium]